MSLPTLTSERLWLATFQRLSTLRLWPATFATFWFATIERLSDYDQRLSRSEVSDFGWRLSDYDRPPSFRVEVRRFSDLQAGGRAGAGGGLIAWRVPVPVVA